MGLSYLDEVSFSIEDELVKEENGNVEHCHESQDPPDHVAPPRIHIRVVVCQGFVLHKTEDEDGLQERKIVIL